jgi:hypothetical protein
MEKIQQLTSGQRTPVHGLEHSKAVWSRLALHRYTFEVGKLSISTRLRSIGSSQPSTGWNGTAGYFTVSLPLVIDANSMTVDAGKSITAKF